MVPIGIGSCCPNLLQPQPFAANFPAVAIKVHQFGNITSIVANSIANAQGFAATLGIKSLGDKSREAHAWVRGTCTLNVRLYAEMKRTKV